MERDAESDTAKRDEQVDDVMKVHELVGRNELSIAEMRSWEAQQPPN